MKLWTKKAAAFIMACVFVFSGMIFASADSVDAPEIVAKLVASKTKTVVLVANPNEKKNIYVEWDADGNGKVDGHATIKAEKNLEIEAPANAGGFKLYWWRNDVNHQDKFRSEIALWKIDFQRVEMKCVPEEAGQIFIEINDEKYDHIAYVALGTEVEFEVKANKGFKLEGLYNKNTPSDDEFIVMDSVNMEARFTGKTQEEPKPTPEPTPTPTPEPTPEPVEPSAPENTDPPIPDGEQVTISDDYAYLYGYDTGEAAPDENVSTAEAAAMIFRLFYQDGKTGGYQKPAAGNFGGLENGNWAFNGMEFMYYLGVYDDPGQVDVWAPVSRGGVAKMLAFAFRVHPENDEPLAYDDIKESDANYTYIKALSDQGIMGGFPDNTIRAGANLTRAEFVKMVNALIGRDDSYIVTDEDNEFPDLEKGHWSYKEMLRASHSFSYDENNRLVVDLEKKRPKEDME